MYHVRLLYSVYLLSPKLTNQYDYNALSLTISNSYFSLPPAYPYLGICFAKAGEVAQTNVLLFVLHGGESVIVNLTIPTRACKCAPSI